jgi:hypothetical protein
MLQFVTLSVATAPLNAVWYNKCNWCISGFYSASFVMKIGIPMKRNLNLTKISVSYIIPFFAIFIKVVHELYGQLSCMPCLPCRKWFVKTSIKFCPFLWANLTLCGSTSLSLVLPKPKTCNSDRHIPLTTSLLASSNYVISWE